MSMIHEITSTTPRYKRQQRKGRGESSGRGKTCGRGNKGAKARVGTYIKRGHEGGQTPIFRRFPKRGFSNENFERRFHIVNVSELARFDDGASVDAAVLIEAGLVADDRYPVKILGDGTIGKKLTVAAGWYSKSAYQKIIDSGGTANDVTGKAFEFPKPKKKFVPREPVKKVRVEESAAEAAPARAEAPKQPAAPEAGETRPKGEEEKPATEG